MHIPARRRRSPAAAGTASAGLRYIDFIKVQSAINGSAGGLGELSTEVAGMAIDENLNR